MAVIGLVAAGIIRLLVYVPYMRCTGVLRRGVLLERAEALLSRLGLAEPPAKGALDYIVDRGWFMPRISMLLTPARLLSGSVAVGRLFIGAVNFGLMVAAIRMVTNHFGKIATWTFLVPTALIRSS